MIVPGDFFDEVNGTAPDNDLARIYALILFPVAGDVQAAGAILYFSIFFSQNH